jgi:hypothetical protein
VPDLHAVGRLGEGDDLACHGAEYALRERDR